jgi:hypothetical protein
LGLYGAWQFAPVIQSLSPCEVNRLIVVAIVLGSLQHIFKLDSRIDEKNLSVGFEARFPIKKGAGSRRLFYQSIS